MVEILQKEQKILRQIAKPVPVEDIPGAEIRRVLKDMKDALASQEDGVAIAAPQIGVPLRIFIISPKVFETRTDIPAASAAQTSAKHLVFINPEIIKLSKKKMFMDEGCLSVRWLYGEVKRATNATVSAYDENGRRFTRGAGDILAHIIQHETDHLDGVLFIDKAKNIQEIHPDDKEK